MFLSASTEMGTFLWLMLLFPGLSGLTSSVPRQFHVVKEEKTQTEAQQYCREKFTDLATVDDMTEMEGLTGLIQEEGVTKAWIGLTYGSSPKWQWSLADRDFYGENEAEFRNWASGQPGGDIGDCVYVRPTGQWFDDNCDQEYDFVCYDGTPNSNHPYVLIEEATRWADAQRYCRLHYTDLASVRNQAENDQIDAVRQTWIGLFQDPWEWSDGSDSSFRHWALAEPSYGYGPEFCVEMWPSGLWNNIPCTMSRNIICYEEMRKTVVVRVQLPVASHVDLEDPVVQNALLQQIGHQLVNQGLPPNVNVSWRKQADGKVFNKEENGGKKQLKEIEL